MSAGPIKFISRGLVYEASLRSETMLESIHRVYEDGKRRAVPCYDKQFGRISSTFWRTYHNSRSQP